MSTDFKHEPRKTSDHGKRPNSSQKSQPKQGGYTKHNNPYKEKSHQEDRNRDSFKHRANTGHNRSEKSGQRSSRNTAQKQSMSRPGDRTLNPKNKRASQSKNTASKTEKQAREQIVVTPNLNRKESTSFLATESNQLDQREHNGYAGRPQKRKRSSGRATPARLVALDAIRTIRERSAYAQETINHAIDHSSLTPEDRAFATRLVLGVVATQGALDQVIDKTLNDPKDISPQVRDALRIATYEILFLDKLYHAAVDQGVELVKSVAPPAAGVANFALRSIVRMRSEFPFGDPRTDLDALSLLYGFPSWITILLMSDLGPETVLAFLKESNEPAPLFIAINHIKTRDELVLRAFDRLEEPLEQVSIDNHLIPGCYKVEESRALLLPEIKRLFKSGRLMVTDATSQYIAQNVLPDELPRSFLEVGAGRATKTILIQNEAQRRWGSQIQDYVAIDNLEFKTNILKERVEQFDIHVSEAITADALELQNAIPMRTFDAIFLDAPCSGLGTLRRHPEIRWRLTPEDVVSLAKTQLAMLKALAPFVAPGGTLSYATCTVTHLENNKVVKAFLDSDEGKEFRLIPIAGKSCIATKLEPGSPDAHFAVRFLRNSEPNSTIPDTNNNNNSTNVE